MSDLIGLSTIINNNDLSIYISTLEISHRSNNSPGRLAEGPGRERSGGALSEEL